MSLTFIDSSAAITIKVNCKSIRLIAGHCKLCWGHFCFDEMMGFVRNEVLCCIYKLKYREHAYSIEQSTSELEEVFLESSSENEH